MAGGQTLIILVVEDDPNDTLLLQRALKKNGIDLPMHVCGDGAEAMAYLKGQDRYANRDEFPFPRVLVTDLKMPRCSGFDLLEWLHQHPECNLFPKIVLSASAQEADVSRAYQLGANCYFRKPSTFEELCKLVQVVNAFWLAAVMPPLPETC
jgi:CheY-like chemotaxis protein